MLVSCAPTLLHCNSDYRHMHASRYAFVVCTSRIRAQRIRRLAASWTRTRRKTRGQQKTKGRPRSPCRVWHPSSGRVHRKMLVHKVRGCRWGRGGEL